MHRSIIACVKLFGSEELGHIPDHVEVVVHPLTAKYETIAPADKRFFYTLPQTYLPTLSPRCISEYSTIE